MHMLGDPRLKAAHSPDVAASIQQTYGGMAHFAGTGPDGRTCRECAGWCRNAAKFARDEIKDGGGASPPSVPDLPKAHGRPGWSRGSAYGFGLPSLLRGGEPAPGRAPFCHSSQAGLREKGGEDRLRREEGEA